MTRLSSNALSVLEARYLKRSPSGSLSESPDEMLHRVTRAVAEAEFLYGGRPTVELWTQKFYNLLSSLSFLPNSPTLMNAGFDEGQLSACFVLPIKDSTKDIFETLISAALIQKSGGGTGFNFSAVRPIGSHVVDQGRVAAGPLGFLKIFDATTEQIKQSGRRRGANMAILNVSHPDIPAFIKSKHDERMFRNFNLSVGVSDSFMKAVSNHDAWKLFWSNREVITKEINADNLWGEIVDSAWLSGDPGLIFLDAIEEDNPTPSMGRITATNPCGEMPLMDYESCNLGSINLSQMLKSTSTGAEIDWNKLDTTVAEAVRFLDDVIDVNYFPISESKKLVSGNRKIGLGIMGWAEMLIKMNVAYASNRGVQLAEQVMARIQQRAITASEQLASIKGTFPNWERSVHYPDSPRRNATITSIAPTGSISIIADTSSSIEPLYSLSYNRHNILDGRILHEVDQNILAYLETNRLTSDALKDQIVAKGTIQHLTEFPEEVKQMYLIANEIPYNYHLAHQAAFQKYTDNAVSKTINLPNNATREDISDIFIQAWQLRLKGITVYRDGCRSAQVLQYPLDKTVHRHVEQSSCRLCDIG